MMRLLTIGAMSAFLMLCAACSPRVVTRTVPVRVEVIRYVPIPRDLLTPCPGYVGPLETNDDLVTAYVTERKEGTACGNERLRRIGEIGLPEQPRP